MKRQRITKEDREIIEKVCPKFSRICQCYVNNPEYGVTLSPKARRALNEAKKVNKQSKKSNVASVRLNDEEMQKLKCYMEFHNTTITAVMHELIRWMN